MTGLQSYLAHEHKPGARIAAPVVTVTCALRERISEVDALPEEMTYTQVRKNIQLRKHIQSSELQSIGNESEAMGSDVSNGSPF